MSSTAQLPDKLSLLKYDEAAILLGIKEQTLRLWCSKRLIPFTRIGKGSVRFRLSDLEKYLDARAVEPVAARK